MVVGLVVFFIFAPVVPFERQQSIYAPKSPVLCPGTYVCEMTFFNVWVRSYGSLTYDFFGFGTAPFVGPVSVEKNGVVTVMLFNGTNGSFPIDSVAYPASSPEPLPLVRVNGLTVYPNGAPFGGTVTQISVTNMGVGETVEVNWGSAITSSKVLPAGATVLINSTDWTREPLPLANTITTITLSYSVHYPKFWLYGTHTQSVEVTYAP